MRSAPLLVALFVGFLAARCSATRPPCVFVESPGGYGRVHAAWRSTPPSPRPCVFVQSATGAPIPADRETIEMLAALCAADEGAR